MTETIEPKRIGRRRHLRDIAWLRARVDINPDSGCWEWNGIRNHRGYGRYHYTTDAAVLNGSAHRLALELALGRPLRPGMNACHRCDNPPCCNSEHLFEGTTADNHQDCRGKGRARHRQGEEHGMAKLRDGDIPKILAMLATGETQRYCATLFGVSQPTISRIKKQGGWQNVKTRP